MAVLNSTTRSIARWFESDEVYHQIEYLVQVWEETRTPIEELGRQLRLLVEDVSKRAHDSVDLSDVDWDALAQYYADLFSQA